MIMNKNTWLLFAPFVLLSAFFSCAGRPSAQEGYDIKITLRGITGGKTYLGFYYGDNLYVKDSAIFNDKGVATFKGKEPLAHGLYFCYNDSGRTKFDFIVARPKIEIATSVQQPLEDLDDIGAEDNDRYREFRMGIDKYLKNTASLRSAISAAKDRNDSLKHLAAIRGNEAELQKEQARIIASCKGSVTGDILNLMRMEKRKPEKNDALTDSLNADEAFRYYREHYWDYINLGDTLVLRVPVLQQKVQEYFSTIIPQQPDSLVRAIDALVAKTATAGPVRRELLLMLGSKYATPDVTDQDAVFVHLADQYYLIDKLPDWIDTTRFKYIKEVRDKMAPNIVGKKAPPFTLTSVNGTAFSLDQLHTDRTLLLFYDPECDHCHKEVDAMKLAYQELTKNQVSVVTICVSPEEQKWKKYVQDRKLASVNLADPHRTSSFRKDYNVYATPLLMVLDKQKTIIGKGESLKALTPLLLKRFETAGL